MSKKDCQLALDEKAARELLTSNGLNRTKGKLNILLVLSKSKKPLSVPEIHALLKESCDLSTVFRTITQLKDKNLIQEINFDEGFFRYEMRSQEKHSHHHHHIRCRKCGDIKHLEKCNLLDFEKAISKLGFTDMEHRLEFSGLCSRCSKT